MLKLSIITINYNNLEGLKRTVESVVHQTWGEFEYIIIDGGSSDGSAEYIESQSHHFDFWISEKDTGIYNAMNKGIKVATGEYLLFLNSGDHFFSDKVLEDNHRYLEVKDLVYFNLNVIDDLRTFIKKYPERLLFSYFLKDTLPHPASFIKKKLFTTVGLYDENLKVVSDWKFFIVSICKHNVSYSWIDEIMSTFYLDGLSSNPKNIDIIAREKQQVLELNFTAYLNDNEELSSLKRVVSNLKKSKKIKILVMLGFLNKF